jgi:hypothetical protein
MKTPQMGCLDGWSAERQDRTVDTAIFSRVLYQLSYLGMRADFTIGREAVKKTPMIYRLNHFFIKIFYILVTFSGFDYLIISRFSFDNLPCEH